MLPLQLPLRRPERSNGGVAAEPRGSDGGAGAVRVERVAPLLAFVVVVRSCPRGETGERAAAKVLTWGILISAVWQNAERVQRVAQKARA